jgi:pyruvate,water dikinase
MSLKTGDLMKNIAWFKELTKKSIPIAGGKGANLAELFNLRIPVPIGFVVTAQAYKKFLDVNKLQPIINKILNNLDVENNEKLQEASEKIQDLILEYEIPIDIKQEIINAYKNLYIDTAVLLNASKETLSMIKAGRTLPFVAVRSSATAEDLPEASFAGQQATYVNVKGMENVVKAVHQCWASLYTARAIYYREKNNFPHEKVLIAVIVQKMVNSTKAGVVFTANPATGNENEIVIEAGFGLGDAVVSGAISPDNYVVDKNTLGLKAKKIKKQDWMFTRDEKLGRTIKKKLSDDKASNQVLKDSEIQKITSLTKRI